ncbi:metabotropic glutamate receptor 1-like [Planococcus citri]|uniref:metabotropic glutamate receptor 1-like n=1 Tax=Planococcus citri TaxID=170843 RepID=UPI0031FA03AC
MKRHRYTFLLIFFISTVSQKNANCDNESSSKKDSKPSIKIDVILLLSRNGGDGKCADEFHPDALQNVEALYYALDLIQKDDKLSQKFNLTVDIMEVCRIPNLELKHLSKLYDQLKVDPIEHENATFGLIYDTVFTTFNYENIFDTFRTFPHISYSGPPTKLNDADVIAPQFTFDFITSTSGHIFIADVILEILNHFKWKYVTVHDPQSGSRDGQYEMAKFFERRVEKLAESNDICIVNVKESIIEAAENVLTQTHTRTSSMADVILCFCDQQAIENLKDQLQNRNKKYVVIVGNTELCWTNKVEWNSTLGDLYYVTPSFQYNENFYHYYTSLSEENYTRYPYLEKFRKRYSKYDRKKMSNGTSMYTHTYQNNSNSAINIIKSLYTMAHVIKRTFDSKSKKDRYEAKSVLRNIEFNIFNENISFTERSGLPRIEKFDIHKFQAVQNESGYFIRVAEYLKTNHTEYNEGKNHSSRIQGNLTILDASFQYPKHYPMQRCSVPCPATYIRTNHENQCCWKCEKCDIFSIPHRDGTSCEKCGEGLMANQNYTACIPSPLFGILQIPTECTDIQNLLSIGLSSLSIILTAVVLLVFVKYQNTPAVKSTTKELCYVMFAGIILVNTTILISTVTSNFLTSDVKVLPAIGFTMIYAALLVKTNRIARLLVTSKHRFANMNLKYLSLKAQIIITAILIAIEIVICWFAVKFQDPDPDINGSDFILKMYYLDRVFLFKIFAFVTLLILLCTYYAVKTRNLPENFNEAKCIGFAMYTTVLTAIASSTVYFTTDEKKVLAMNVCASINTLIILIFLFSPKLYIILWKPERNTIVFFSPVTSGIRSYMGKESRTNSRKPLNQCYSLENSGPQSSLNNAAENLKEHDRSVAVKVIEEIDILHKEINLDLKEKFKTGDLKLDEIMDNLQKAYSEKTENIKLKYIVEADRTEKNAVK